MVTLIRPPPAIKAPTVLKPHGAVPILMVLCAGTSGVPGLLKLTAFVFVTVLVVVVPPGLCANSGAEPPMHIVVSVVGGVNVLLNDAVTVGVGVIGKSIVVPLSHPPAGGVRVGSNAT